MGQAKRKKGRGLQTGVGCKRQKQGPDCVNKVNSQVRKYEQRSKYLANVTEEILCVHVNTWWGYFFNMVKLC